MESSHYDMMDSGFIPLTQIGDQIVYGHSDMTRIGYLVPAGVHAAERTPIRRASVAVLNAARSRVRQAGVAWGQQ